MAKTQVEAIAFSDIHLNDWAQNNPENIRTVEGLEIIKKLSKVSIANGKVPLIFSGDLFHRDTYIHQVVNHQALVTYKDFIESEGIPFVAIAGNHDMCEKNYYKEHRSPTHLDIYRDLFSTFNLLDFSSKVVGNIKYHGIPYINGNKNFVEAVIDLSKAIDKTKFNILLVHTDLPNAKNEFGIDLDTHNLEPSIYELFKKWDLCLSGHIHLNQKLSDNTYMLGAPNQQDRGEYSSKFGYWLIYNKAGVLKPKFVELAGYRFGEPEQSTEPEMEIDEELSTEESLKGAFSDITKRASIAESYCKAVGKNDQEYIQTLTDLLQNA
jgi:DNA repair exonuclease SbcCD nuclease subunit